MVADRHPGEGPLGALVTALDAAGEEIVAVLACDLPYAEPAGVEAGVRALTADAGAAWAAPVPAPSRRASSWSDPDGAR